MNDIGGEQGAPLVGDAPFGAGGLGMADGIALLLYELFQLTELRVDCGAAMATEASSTAVNNCFMILYLGLFISCAISWCSRSPR